MSSKPLKPYSVEISVVSVVMATDAEHAREVAEETACALLRDVSVHDCDYGTTHEIKSESDLRHISWDDQCLPYGGDGRTTLREILAAKKEVA